MSCLANLRDRMLREVWKHAVFDVGMMACIDPHGHDAGKKIKGKKRHVLVDTLGLLLHAIVHPADMQDRDGGILVLAASRQLLERSSP